MTKTVKYCDVCGMEESSNPTWETGVSRAICDIRPDGCNERGATFNYDMCRHCRQALHDAVEGTIVALRKGRLEERK